MTRTCSAFLLVVFMAAPGRATAQSTSDRPAPTAPDSAATFATSGFPKLRVAKWSTLTFAAAAGIYGFVESARADDRYNELESLCQASPADCQLRTADGAYQDTRFETLYQTVRRHDRRAHYSLIAGQVGVATSVVLFLLDLGNAHPPRDIPWVPRDLRVRRTRGGADVGIWLPLGRRD